MRTDTHFLKLAACGHLPGASSGHVQALMLARCVVGNVPGLDCAAVDGLVDFIYAAQVSPGSARDLVRSWKLRKP
jgi:hypothetical protein